MFFFYVKFCSALESLTAFYQHIPIKTKEKDFIFKHDLNLFVCLFEVSRS